MKTVNTEENLNNFWTEQPNEIQWNLQENVVSCFRKMGFSGSLEKFFREKSQEGCQIDFLGLKWQGTQSFKVHSVPLGLPWGGQAFMYPKT